MRPSGALAAAMVALSTLIATAAHGEAVRLLVGGRDDGEGQGWLFKSEAGFCGVITAAHVVAPHGRVGAIRILSTTDLDGVGRDTRILSPVDELDVALVRVTGPLQEHGCTQATLGASDVSFMLEKTHRGTVEQVSDAKERVWTDVAFMTSAGGDPAVLSLLPINARTEINGGYSGSPVVELQEARLNVGVRPAPLAMITEVIPGEQTHAVRFDRIRELVLAALGEDAAPGANQDAAPSGGFRVVDWTGVSVDGLCPATSANADSTACGWRAKPAGTARYVSFTVEPAGDLTASATLAVKTADGGERQIVMEAAASADSKDWAWLASTVTRDGQGGARFLPTNARRIRFSVSAAPGEVVELRLLSLR